MYRACLAESLTWGRGDIRAQIKLIQDSLTRFSRNESFGNSVLPDAYCQKVAGVLKVPCSFTACDIVSPRLHMSPEKGSECCVSSICSPSFSGVMKPGVLRILVGSAMLPARLLRPRSPSFTHHGFGGLLLMRIF